LNFGDLDAAVALAAAVIIYACEMTVADDIELLVARTPGLTEAELAGQLFGREGYQQRVNSTCRHLINQGRIERHGRGGPSDPFTYHLARIAALVAAEEAQP